MHYTEVRNVLVQGEVRRPRTRIDGVGQKGESGRMGVEEINIPREIEADGYITRKQDLRSRPLERVTDNTANPTSECCYPRCEECKDYVSFQGANYCTVPMVITKQTWLLTTALITDLRRDIDEAREMVYDHILNENHRVETGNYSVGEEQTNG